MSCPPSPTGKTLILNFSQYLELLEEHNEQFLYSDISDLRAQVDGLSIVEGSPEMDHPRRSPTRAYITISQVSLITGTDVRAGFYDGHQAANEKHANLVHKQNQERAR